MGEISREPGRRLLVADYVAFDLETTGLSPETDEILEVAMVRFQSGKPVERWSSLVNPGIPVPLKTLRLTHIAASDLVSSPPMADLLDKIQDFRRDLPLVGHNSGFDASFLSKRIPGFPGVPLYDTLELSRIVLPGFSTYRLTDLALAVGVPVSEAHRAYDDAEVSGVIFRLLQEAIWDMSPAVRDAVRHLLGSGWVAAHMFVSSSGREVRPASPIQASLFEEPVAAPQQESGIARVAAPRNPEGLRFDPAAVESPAGQAILSRLRSEEGFYALNLSETAEVARSVAHAAAHYAQSAGKKVLLVGFPAESIPEGAARAGAPGDYVCLAKLEEAAKIARAGGYGSVDGEHRRFLASLYRWSETTCTGGLSEVQWGSAGIEVVPEIACPPSMGCQEKCPMRDRCFYLLSKEELARPGGVLACASHASALSVEDRFDATLVFAAAELGRTWLYREPRVDLQVLKGVLGRLRIHCDTPALDGLLYYAGQDLSRGGMVSSETMPHIGALAAQLAEAARSLRASRGGGSPEGYPVDPPILWKDLHALELAAQLLRGFCSDPPPDASLLVEQSYGDESQRGAVLVRRHVWPAQAAVTALRERTGRLVMLSDLVSAASRSIGGRKILGLDEDPPAFADSSALLASPASPVAPTPANPVPSPGECDGRDRVLFAVLDGGRMVSPQEYPAYLASFIVPLGLSVRKGLLVAFPSRTLLKETYALVQPELEGQGIAVYGQGVDGGRRVIDHLADEDSVVFVIGGSGPGPKEPVARCLVLAKVPFAPPNPLDEVRRRQARSSAGGFVEVSVRPAALALRAYIEKMLVSGEQHAVVVTDPKALPGKSNWGSEFMAAFDDLPRLVCPAPEILSRLRDLR
ncbi:MAG: exonuclease domain-containing protein [Bacillota bacterium]